MTIQELTEKVEEISQIYAKKFKIKRDSSWFVLKLQEEMGEMIQAYLMLEKQARQKGKTTKQLNEDFEKEVADVFCHILLLAHFYKIDIEKVVAQKWLKWKK